jgi:uncharacterized protein (DUF1778 family)
MAIPTKTEIVSTRATPARKALYRAAAEVEGLRLSEWLRRIADRHAAEMPRERGAGAQVQASA